MILIDTETTDLNQISSMPLDKQPRIIELYARKLDDTTLEQIEEIEFMCNPGIPIPELVTKITGLTDAMVAGKRRFAAHYRALADFFLGERVMVGHNLPHDRQCLVWELMRIDKLYYFPWPPEHVCTVERSQDIKGHYVNLKDLYIHYYGTDPGQVHRGRGDVDILHAVVRKMREENRL